MIHGAPVYRLRGNLLPLVYLDRELGSSPHANPSVSELPQAATREINIVVLQADDRQFGLVVDAIHDTEEIVVKPLQKQLKGINAFAGATIMGDGKVALILDVLGLAQRANVVSGVRERSLSEKAAAAPEQQAIARPSCCSPTGDGGRMAIPLSVVARLEEFPRSALERVGNQLRRPVPRRDPAAVPRVAFAAPATAFADVTAGRRPVEDPPVSGQERHGAGRGLCRQGPACRPGRRPDPRHRRGDHRVRAPAPAGPACCSRP